MKTLAAGTNKRIKLPFAPKSTFTPSTCSIATVHHRTRLKRNSQYIGLFAVLTVSGIAGIALYNRHNISISGSSQYLGSLNPNTFTSYTLTTKNYISTNNAVFTLEGPETKQLPGDAWSSENTLSSIQVKQPELQIARAYTPLPIKAIDENGSLSLAIQDSPLQFLIKKEEKGEVSRYLHNLPIGSQIEVRGPQIEYELPQNLQEVLFIAGGTGIVPALQVARLLQLQSSTRMHILWANRKEEDIIGNSADVRKASENIVTATGFQKHPVIEQLDILKRQWGGEGHKKITLDIFVDERNHYISINDVKRHIAVPPGKDQAGRDRLILVSGPDGFVGYWAGPKVWRDGQETQGQLGGLLSQLNLDQWQIWKL